MSYKQTVPDRMGRLGGAQGMMGQFGGLCSEHMMGRLGLMV